MSALWSAAYEAKGEWDCVEGSSHHPLLHYQQLIGLSLAEFALTYLSLARHDRPHYRHTTDTADPLQV